MNIVMTVILWITYILSLYIIIYWLIVFFVGKKDFDITETKTSLSRYPHVSVLVPAYNEGKTVVHVLESVVGLDYPKEKLEIIVINDGSTDDTGERAREFIKQHKRFDMKLINQNNMGKAASLNNALKTAKGEFFACLDADSFVDPKTLRKMLKVYEDGDENLAIVTPAMKVKSPKTLLQRIQWLEYLVSLFLARLMSHVDCIYVAPGPFSLYRTAVIQKLGGFDTKTITEDQEIAYRSQKHHYKLKQCFDGYVHTIAPRNIKSLYKQRKRWLKGGMLNIYQYRRLIWNRDYGDFGIMQMSINTIIFFVSTATLFFFGFYVLKPLYEAIRNLYLINFDIRPYISDITNFKFMILNLDLEKMVILYLLFIISAIIIYLSHRNANEEFKKNNIFVLLGYFLVYYVGISLIIVVMLFEILFDKEHKWQL